jgi:hypothetical protein
VATYWVRSSGGDDGNPGTSFAQAKATLTAALALLTTKGDVLNVVNDGNHTCPTTAVNITTGAGTNFTTDPGYTIRGTDEDGNPAMATVVTGTGSAYSMVQFRAGSGYNIVEGLFFDGAAAEADAANVHRYVVINQNTTPFPGPNWIRYCVMRSGTTAVPSQNRTLYGYVTNAPANFGRVSHCVFLDAGNIPVGSGGTAAGGEQLEVDHCIAINTLTGGTALVVLHALVDSDSVASIHHNTVFCSWTGASAMSEGLVNGTGKSGDGSIGTFNLHSNIYYSYKASAFTIGSLITDSAAGTRTIAAGTIGYNILHSYEDVTALAVAGWYAATYDAGADPRATDNVALEEAAATLFFAPGSTYTWDFNGSDYSYELPYDLRPKYGFRNLGLAASVPGAIETTYDVAPVAVDDSCTVVAGESVSGNVLSNDTDADGVPAALTAVKDTDPAHGVVVFNTTTGAFTYTASTTYTGADSFTYRAYDGELYSGTATVNITITAPELVPDDGGGGDAPAEDPAYLDVLPWFEPDLRVSALLSLQTRRNRVVHHDVRAYPAAQQWRESTHRVLELATNTTTQITLGGVQTAEYLLLETTSPIDVAVNTTDAYWPVTAIVALAVSNVTTVFVRNNSTTDAATLVLVVVD